MATGMRRFKSALKKVPWSEMFAPLFQFFRCVFRLSA
jgi:hypothetical protein